MSQRIAVPESDALTWAGDVPVTWSFDWAALPLGRAALSRIEGGLEADVRWRRPGFEFDEETMELGLARAGDRLVELAVVPREATEA